jgi:DNA (cytosine-5)-methyltransferase 1
MKEDIQIIQVDLFSGAGGVTTGSERASIKGIKVSKVIACVNHDENAIKSHAANHSGVYHFTEDIRTMDLTKLVSIVDRYRKLYPIAKLLLWASLECTNFSKAKGGLPRDEDSRTLAKSLYMKYDPEKKEHIEGDSYIQLLKPDFIYIENVEEFMSWGLMDEKGKPISKYKGLHYMEFLQRIKNFGFDFDFRMLNCADYGAHTSRIRFFGQFVKYGLQTSWPMPTHSKNARLDMFNNFEKWKPVREVLNLEDEGTSIFDRKKQHVEATLERVYSGLLKFVAGGKNKFISKYFSGDPESKNISIEGPTGAITTVDHHSIVSTSFLAAYYGNGDNVSSIEKPCPTVPTKDRFNLVNPRFIDQQYGQSKAADIEQPIGTLTLNPKFNLVTCKPWVMNTNFSNVGSSVNDPAPVITANRKWHYLVNPQFSSDGASIENPCFTLIARMDKRPPSIVEVSTEIKNAPNFIKVIGDQVVYEIYENDTPMMKRIKEFMAVYGLIDIKMRMLNISELKLITGFPENYILIGTQAEQKKFIGNAVPVIMAQKLIEACAINLMKLEIPEVA